MKKAYWSSDPEKPVIFRNIPVGFTNQESTTENAGRNGWNLLERTTEPLLHGGTNSYEYDDFIAKDLNEDNKIDDEEKDILERVINLLVDLGDDMDDIKEYSLANFTDFLIHKFAEINLETKMGDYSDIQKFNQLILKVNNSDLIDRNETIKKLTNIYSRTLVMTYINTKDIEKAHGSALEKTLHRANQYLSIESGSNPQLEKSAQTFLTLNPILVAKQIKGIIDVMVGRMSPEAQRRAYPNIKNRINNLNILELNGKKSPGGAAIGISITLIKNILNGRDPMFINAVIKELSKYL